MDKEREFNRVPALDKCFGVLELFVGKERPLRISEIARTLNYNKSTVYNILHTLADLGVLEHAEDNAFRFGAKLYALGRSAGNGSELISAVHRSLEEINQRTRLSAFLGVRSNGHAVVLDNVDSSDDIKVSFETGMRIPLLAGAGGKVLLAMLSDAEVGRLFFENRALGLPRNFSTSLREYKKMIKMVRQDEFAFDDEEYIEGVRSLAVPLHLHRAHLQAAIWIAGLKTQIKDEDIPRYKSILAEIAKRIENRFSLTAACSGLNHE
jgi:IclR family transcriptional regulator, KDG regulon repressor